MDGVDLSERVGDRVANRAQRRIADVGESIVNPEAVALDWLRSYMRLDKYSTRHYDAVYICSRVYMEHEHGRHGGL
jgi:hypothetical protein